MSDLYNQLCNMLIRPTRQTYHLYDLGNPIISTYGKRQDFQIISRDNLKLKCSFYRNISPQFSSNVPLPTVIYLHSLNGSRLQFLPYIQSLLKSGFNVATLDFAGCGLSEGLYVTLGAHQKWDILEFIKYIHRNYMISNFILWGRSMGAVAVIKFFNLLQQQRTKIGQLRHINLLALVLDSPFISLNKLAVQIAKNKINMPQILIKVAFYVVQNTIEQKAKFKTSELQLENEVQNINIPTLVITSKRDTLVPFQHSLNIYQKITSVHKSLMYIETQHNSNRQESDIKRIFQYIIQKSKNSPSYNSRNINESGSLQRKIQKLKARSLRKGQNQSCSKQKLNRYQSQKNQIHFTKNNNFFHSNVVNSQVRIQSDVNNLRKARAREFSTQKILIQTNNEQNQTHHKYIMKDSINNSKNYFSTQSPKIFFSKQPIQQQKTNKKSYDQNNEKIKQKFNTILTSIPENCSIQKPLSHALSYKNIQCLKTVQKIKKLQPQYSKDNKDNKHEQIGQQTIKNHMNVITAKLKKKSKNQITKSFLPQKNIQNKIFIPQEPYRTLRKETNAKSSTALQFTHHRNQNIYQRYAQNINKSVQRVEKPITPVFFSNRDIFSGQTIVKPFTPQFPLHSSMRINQIERRKQRSKQSIMKMYSTPPHPTVENKGIKTTLVSAYGNGFEQYRNQSKINQSSERLIPRGQFLDKNTQFISSKKKLSSQIVSMRASNHFQEPKKIFIPKSNANMHGQQNEHQTSIFSK